MQYHSDANACRSSDRTTRRDASAAYCHRRAANGDTAPADCDAGTTHEDSRSHGDTCSSDRYTRPNRDLDAQAYHGDTAGDRYAQTPGGSSVGGRHYPDAPGS
jgi:hypothetical protein